MSDAVSNPDRMTRAEAMAYLRRGPTWMAAHADEIGCEREGGNVFFRLSDLQAWKDRAYRRAPAVREITPQSRPAVHQLPKGMNKLTKRPFGAPAQGGSR